MKSKDFERHVIMICFFGVLICLMIAKSINEKPNKKTHAPIIKKSSVVTELTESKPINEKQTEYYNHLYEQTK